jgi:hypothetical protein
LISFGGGGMIGGFLCLEHCIFFLARFVGLRYQYASFQEENLSRLMFSFFFCKIPISGTEFRRVIHS